MNVDHALPYGMKALKGLPGIKRKEPNQHNKKKEREKKMYRYYGQEIKKKRNEIIKENKSWSGRYSVYSLRLYRDIVEPAANQ